MSLRESADETIKTRMSWLEDAQKARELIELLPEELLVLEGSADCNSDGELKVTFHLYRNTNVDLLRVCKIAGVQGLVTKMLSPNDWYAHGNMTIEGVNITISIYGLPNPPRCIIEPYSKTVIKYRAICEETGEEIK